MKTAVFRAGGALTDRDAIVYIERHAENEAIGLLRRMDYILVIEPRQQGKTSLLNYLMQQAARSDIIFTYVDLSTVSTESESAWYKSLCSRILEQLQVRISSRKWPTVPENRAAWRDFLSQVSSLGETRQRRIVLVFDEVGSAVFSGLTGFFCPMREAHNLRGLHSNYHHLSFILVGVFRPSDLIKDINISPFNVAHRIRLPDFSLEQTQELISKGPWGGRQAEALATRIHYWTAGQPYLTQFLCSQLDADSTASHVDKCEEQLEQSGPSHLSSIAKRLAARPSLLTYCQRIIEGEVLDYSPLDGNIQSQLDLLGVIAADSSGHCMIRNRIYHRALEKIISSHNEVAHNAAMPADPATVRELLESSFSADELQRFCTDRSSFQELKKLFGQKANLKDMVEDVIEYCQKRQLMEELLEEVEKYTSESSA